MRIGNVNRIGIVVAGLVFLAGGTLEAQSTADRVILDEYRHAYDRHDASRRAFVTRGQFENNITGGEREIHSRARLLLASDGESRVVQIGKGGTGTRVVCDGPEAAFKLTKQASGAFAIDYLGSRRAELKNDFDMYYTSQVDPHFRVYGMLIPEIMKSKDFKLESIAKEGGGARPSYKFRFSYKPDPARPFTFRGWWIADPNQSWAVTEYEVGGDGGNGPLTKAPFRERITYRQIGDLLVPQELDATHVWGSTTHRTFKAEETTPDEPPAEMFTLSGYGLGSLAQPAGTGWSLPWTLFALAAVLLVAAALLRIKLRPQPSGAGA